MTYYETRTIKGTKPEDVKKRTDLNNGFKAILSEAIPYAETAIKFYHSLEKLKANQKNNYKLMLNTLIPPELPYKYGEAPEWT